jgi:hypothetical protein
LYLYRTDMNVRAFFLLVIIGLWSSPTCFAFIIKGKVYDAKTHAPLANVFIMNTYSDARVVTDTSGTFAIEVERGHLIEFKALNYKIARVRIDTETAPFYSIAMREGAFDLDEVEIVGRSHLSDSLSNRETYKWAIDHYKLEGADIIQHPFDAMSKRNRQIWAFQKRYEYFEKEKYVDFVFNARLISKITNVDSTQMEDFRRYYRPSYEEIRRWTTYEFLDYIKSSAAAFLRRRQ